MGLSCLAISSPGSYLEHACIGGGARAIFGGYMKQSSVALNKQLHNTFGMEEIGELEIREPYYDDRTLRMTWRASDRDGIWENVK